MSKRTKHICVSTLVVSLLIFAYCTIAFSQIAFIEKWRTLWIETAMTTNSHQWLAKIFPQSVIDEVMEGAANQRERQKSLVSTWDSLAPEVVYGKGSEVKETEDAAEQAQEDFFARYWELDTPEFRLYLKQHPDLLKNGYGEILIEDMEGTLGLVTSQGHPVLVLDTANELLLVKVSGEGYQGKLAIVKDAARTELVKSSRLGVRGQEAGEFGAQEDALLVINMSGFSDVGGHGSGGQVKGSMIIDGQEYGTHSTEPHWKFCGLRTDGKLYVSNYPWDDISDYRWGVEFYPAIIVDGECVVDGSYCMGLQPRTVVGQAVNGDMLLLVIDGRQIGYSLGCTVADCADILEGYHAWQAMNMDGGSSSVMWYNGSYISKSSSVSGRGRYMPDALIVRKKGAE